MRRSTLCGFCTISAVCIATLAALQKLEANLSPLHVAASDTRVNSVTYHDCPGGRSWLGGHRFVLEQAVEFQQGKGDAHRLIAKDLLNEGWTGGDSDLGCKEFDRKSADGYQEILFLYDGFPGRPSGALYLRELRPQEVTLVKVAHFGSARFEQTPLSL